MNAWKLCRACLTTKESFSYHLFENISVETYWFCTSIQVRKLLIIFFYFVKIGARNVIKYFIQVADNDELPKTVCDECYNLLSKYYDFKKTCIQSQNTLISCDDIKFEKLPSAAVSDGGSPGVSDVYEVNYEETKLNLDVAVKKELSDHFDQGT